MNNIKIKELYKKRYNFQDFYEIATTLINQNKLFSNGSNQSVQKQKIDSSAEFNYAYYPVVFETEEIALKMKVALEKHEIFPRRYFYPSLSNLSYVTGESTAVADSISTRILCLPLYHEISEIEQELIARILLRTQNN